MAQISENLLYDTVLAYQRTAALIAAVRLDLFTRIGNKRVQSDVLAESIGASPRGTRILCDYLVLVGFLSKSGDTYGLTPQSRWTMDGNSPRSATSVIDFLAAPEMIALILDDPTRYVREGGSEGLANVSPDNPIWERFARAMVPFAAPVARLMTARARELGLSPTKVLDIAAGHGLYGIEIGKAFPGSTVTAVDWGAVLSFARSNAADLGGRYSTIAGNAFDVDLGTGYDLAILASFLHHFSPEECTDMLRRLRAALAPQGKVFIVDFMPDEATMSPPEAVAFSFLMLATTPKGESHTAAAYVAMAREAGFTGGTSYHSLAPAPHSLLVLEA